MSDSEDCFNNTFSNDNDMDIAIRNIYEACDEHNTGRVLVSKLVEFIKPFMGANVSDLQKLRESLDPDDIDPEVDTDLFYNVMSGWAKKFNQEESLHNISPRHLENPPLLESTPRKSFGNRQLRVYAEAAALNMSVVEKTSFLGTDSNESVMEKSILEEQIKQLAHQSKKFNDELVLARSQLIGQEEQNLVLQIEIEKLSKDLKHEREINDTLMKENKTFEEQRENSFNKQRKIEKLKKDLLHLEKENLVLQNEKSSLDHERQKTEEKMIRIHEKLAKSRKEAIELRAEINMKEEQLNFAEENKKDLFIKIRDLNDLKDNLQEANICLKVEKEKISKLLQDNIKLQSQAVLKFTPQNQSEYKETEHKTENTTNTLDAHDDKDAISTRTPSTQNILKYFQPNTNTASTPNDIKTKAPQATRNEVPFDSPIKTSKFNFYNIDCPIAKRCLKTHDIDLDTNSTPLAVPLTVSALKDECNDSPITPSDTVSPPGMFVVERTGNRKVPQSLDHLENIIFDESCNEDELIQVAFSSSVTSAQASLKDEMAALLECSPTPSPTCANCSSNFEVKRKLDDLCDQIEWLRTENTSLRQSEDQLVTLVQTKETLENANKLSDQKIEELNKTLEIAKDKEEGLLKKCSDLCEDVAKITKELDDKNEEVMLLSNDLGLLENEKEQLLRGSVIDQAMIARLKDDLKTLENTKKCDELKIQNLNAAKESLIEEHKNYIDEYSKQIIQHQEDITRLEEKFYASHDQVTSLLAQHKDDSSTYAKLFLKHQKLIDIHNDLQTEYNYYVNTISASSPKDQTTRQKLQILLKTKDSYTKLETRFEQTVSDKHKECLELSAKIIELEAKCLQLSQSNCKDTPKKPPHDRTQIKLEKLREKIDYLEDVIKKDKVTQGCQQQELEHLQKCNESLIREKLIILKETEESQSHLVTQKTTNHELTNAVSDLIGGSLKVRHNMLKVVKTWKCIFEHVDSIDLLVRHLGEPDMEDFYPSAQMDLEFLVNLKEIVQAQNDLHTTALILDALGSSSTAWFMENKKRDDGKGLKSLNLLSRPMSPDSPNLGSFDVASFSGAGDNTILHIMKKDFEDSADNCDPDSQDVFDGFAPFEDLHKMYPNDHLEFLLTSFRLGEARESPADLQTFVDEFVLTFMVDCTGYKNRLQGQFEVLQAVVMRLVEHLRTFATLGIDLKQQKQSIIDMVRCLFELTKSAERYGAIQHEVQTSRSTNRLITYITTLREQTSSSKMALGLNLHGENVYLDSIQAAPSSNSSNELSATRQNVIISMLNTMRPTNVVRLVGAAALAFLVYYFSQRFVSLLAASDSFGGGRRDAICWSTWLDFLAACIGRLHPDGPPPV